MEHDLLRALAVISLLLMARAILSRSWQTMWAAAMFSLAFSLIAVWSIGALLFLLTCLQLAAALAMRRAVGLAGWVMFILPGALAYVVIVYGLAILNTAKTWPVVFPLAFIIGSLPLFSKSPRPTT